MLNDVERDFIEFLAEKRSRPREEIERVFLDTKRRFCLSGYRYRELMVDIHDVHRILYDDANEQDLVDSYKFHELIHLFRFLSYSYTKSAAGLWDGVLAFIRLLSRGEFGKIRHGLRQLASKVLGRGTDYASTDRKSLARFLAEAVNDRPVVVDYGCGLGHTAFEIGKAADETKVYLLDVDCLVLEFAAYRFGKHGIDAETIPVTKENLYPKLPPHNICIASEVMEHVMQPLVVYQNILESLAPGGILFGSFEDHIREMFHVSPDLSELRKRIREDFEPVGNSCYRKRK